MAAAFPRVKTLWEWIDRGWRTEGLWRREGETAYLRDQELREVEGA